MKLSKLLFTVNGKRSSTKSILLRLLVSVVIIIAIWLLVMNKYYPEKYNSLEDTFR